MYFDCNAVIYNLSLKFQVHKSYLKFLMTSLHDILYFLYLAPPPPPPFPISLGVSEANVSVSSKPVHPHQGDPGGFACFHCPGDRVFAHLSLPGGSGF